ncbi:MAG: LysM peptidoglycan-binding domain-containing protein, partial [Thermoguttaceae bacterium]|nr:LysM peptidoglycan-binding domain-containing protein [Thermoguttaceae bacterium]
MSVSILSFAFLGVATVLPESAWERLPARLIPVRTLLADRGIISKRFATSPTVTQIDGSGSRTLSDLPSEPLQAESGQIAAAIPPAAESAAQPPRRSRLGLSSPDTVLPPPATTIPAEVPVSSSSYEFISPLAPARPREYSPEPAETQSEIPAADFPAAGFPVAENPPEGIPPIQDTSAPPIDLVNPPAARKLQSRFDSEQSSSPQGVLVPQDQEETPGGSALQGDRGTSDPTGFLPLLRSSESPQATDDTLPQLRFEASPGVHPADDAASTMLSQNASPEPAGSTVAQRLDAALAASSDPDRKLETFLELNRIVNQSGALLGDSDRQRVYSVLDHLAFDIFYNPKVFLLEPGYQVQSSETLASIAPRYSVEPEFLAVLNHLKIGPNDPLPAGTQLKVIRGPVDAQVSLSRME